MKVLCTDRGGKFVSIKLKDICKQKRIIIKYAAPYIHKKKRMAE